MQDPLCILVTNNKGVIMKYVTLKKDFYTMQSTLKLRLIKAAQAGRESINNLLGNIIDRTPFFANIKPSPIIVKRQFPAITRASPPRKGQKTNRMKIKTQVKKDK